MNFGLGDKTVKSSYKIGNALDLLELENTPINAIVTDPPYQILTWKAGGLGGAREMYKTELQNIGSTPDFNLLDFTEKFEAVCNPFILIAFCMKTQIAELIRWAEDRGYTWDLLTWHKITPIPFTSGHLLRDTEYIFYAKEPSGYFPPSGDLDYKDFKTYHVADSPRYKANHGGIKTKSIEHPCAKPLDLMEKLVKIACPRGGTILDPFAGSGTTLRAAVKNGRSAIGYEINPEWEELLKAATNGRQTILELPISQEVIT